MQKIFDEVNSLDKRCYEKYFLTEDILMEHAASSMCKYIEDIFEENKSLKKYQINIVHRRYR